VIAIQTGESSPMTRGSWQHEFPADRAADMDDAAVKILTRNMRAGRKLDSAVVRVASRATTEPQFVDADDAFLRSICKESEP
jgi:hypothetical protein